ncbi:MAG: aspartate carbamoyltransferase [Candidatus Woykebacteria bacterium RBG_13_40_7b]|uniref:Aspartate carbamoyltransferase n=1 Tax=Candidatus Woykebacteria bacterium RBG_13_40_7b TaxID=1802594 RepID=A0A1G1W8C3_9BACT|nr:MAG: aspartate carbamoyltransferase [Candidatus Woykebacteria bacterium RBG_13_40_7b]
MKNFLNQHILAANQFTRKNLEQIFEKARELEPLNKPGKGTDLLKGYIIALLFYEPSTRTRSSFDAASKILGAWTITTESASISSSAVKGESIEDTIKVLNGYSDAIVIRHPELGSAKRAAVVSQVPIINAGDGPGSHPTQSLTDMYTIEKELGKIDGVSVAVVGDLRYGRAARSFCEVISRFKNIKIYFVSPTSLRMKDDVKKKLIREGIKFVETEVLEDVLDKVDIVNMTRIQKERFANEEDYLKVKGVYVLKRSHLRRMKKHSIVMHVLPRVDEISYDVDDDPRAAYFRQSKNHIAVRMALLSLVLGKE